MATNTEQCRVHIRWMIRRDMPEVMCIEAACFEYPWSESDFLECLRQRNYIGMVAESNDLIAGFTVYELHKTRLHIVNFAVLPDFQRSGVGAQMVSKLVGKLCAQRRTRITVDVRESNLGAQLFFKTQGFFATGIVESPYDDSDEDAYSMQLRHPGEFVVDTMPLDGGSRKVR